MSKIGIDSEIEDQVVGDGHLSIHPRCQSFVRAISEWIAELGNVRDFFLLDTAIEWAEDQIVYRYGGSIDFLETTELSEQPLLAGLGIDRSRFARRDQDLSDR